MNDNEAYGIVAVVGLVVFGGCFLAWLYYKSRNKQYTVEQLKRWGVIIEQ